MWNHLRLKARPQAANSERADENQSPRSSRCRPPTQIPIATDLPLTPVASQSQRIAKMDWNRNQSAVVGRRILRSRQIATYGAHLAGWGSRRATRCRTGTPGPNAHWASLRNAAFAHGQQSGSWISILCMGDDLQVRGVSSNRGADWPGTDYLSLAQRGGGSTGGSIRSSFPQRPAATADAHVEAYRVSAANMPPSRW